MSHFDRTPENFHDRSITRPILESTGLPEGDDSGYRKVPVQESGEKMVDLGQGQYGALLRPSYDGYDEATGSYDDRLVLPGGTDGRVYVRTSVAKAIQAADGYFAERYGKNMKLGILDGFRSGKRQAAGFTRKVIEVLRGNKNPDTKALYEAGMTADGTFSWVNPDFDAQEWINFLADMATDTKIFPALQEIASEAGIDVKEAVENFATICANIRAVQTAFPNAPATPLNMDIPLNFQNNAHAGGGAIDTFLMINGKPASSPVPFDWVGEEAAIEFMENDGNLDRFRAKALQDITLQGYLTRLGIDPQNITTGQWEFWRSCNRILHHTMKAIGATYYSAANPANGGENWHKEPGNIVLDPRKQNIGERIWYRGMAADTLPDSGNPGHALQRMEKGRARAVWGGKGAHEHSWDFKRSTYYWISHPSPICGRRKEP